MGRNDTPILPLSDGTLPGELSKADFVFGQSAAMDALNRMVADIAPTDIPVLVIGESGVGKDACIRLIHRLSRHRDPALTKINCSATGSDDFLSRLRNASSGTVYLDNIQDLSADCQRLLLAQLPDAEGALSKASFAPRFLSSTLRNLEVEVEAGRFRRELYFRLNGATLRLPPLRERREDLPALLDHFLRKHSELLNKRLFSISSKAQQTLAAYHWPGNIRELENLARKMVVFGDVQMTLNDLQAVRMVNQQPGESRQETSLKVAARAASKQAERELIIQALERTRWNRKRAAHDLQISYKSLLHKIKQIGPLNGEQG